MVLSHLRFAAGVCVLAAGLLMGAGGAVAVADPGSSDSAAHADQQSTDAKKPKDEADRKKPKDKPGGTNTKDGSLGSSGQPGQQPSTGAKKPKDRDLAARTPRMGRKTTRTSVPRFPIRSPRLRTRSRRFLWR